LRLTSPLKAKWVKVELRKIETLPGGGQANTYIDMIGESPLTVWQAKGEWDELQTVSPNYNGGANSLIFISVLQHDFPFQIRIPETVPPSIALERGAGIKYELVASVFVKGKKSVLSHILFFEGILMRAWLQGPVASGDDTDAHYCSIYRH